MRNDKKVTEEDFVAWYAEQPISYDKQDEILCIAANSWEQMYPGMSEISLDEYPSETSDSKHLSLDVVTNGRKMQIIYMNHFNRFVTWCTGDLVEAGFNSCNDVDELTEQFNTAVATFPLWRFSKTAQGALDSLVWLQAEEMQRIVDKVVSMTDEEYAAQVDKWLDAGDFGSVELFGKIRSGEIILSTGPSQEDKDYEAVKAVIDQAKVIECSEGVTDQCRESWLFAKAEGEEHEMIESFIRKTEAELRIKLSDELSTVKAEVPGYGILCFSRGVSDVRVLSREMKNEKVIWKLN